jgi:type IX secretion system PorP/SprF family membrane protein
MKKRLLALSTLVLASTGVFGQQDMALTHFIYNKQTFNPGASGMDEGICGTLLYRNQWDRVNGAPNSAVFNGEANLDRWIPAGVGLAFSHDAIGFNRQNTLLLNYAHHLTVKTAGTLGIGVGLGILNFGSSPTWVPPNTLLDPLLPASSSATTFDMNAGLFWKGNLTPYYIGLSATHLTAPSLAQQSIIAAASATSYTSARHYYAMGGYTFKNLGPGDLDIQAMMRTDLVKYSVDINARYIFSNILYGGLTYRTSDAIAVMAGFTNLIKERQAPYRTTGSYVIGYSYDLTLNQLSSVSRGTHELLVKYCYFIPPPPIQKSKHPRWL